MRKQFFPILFCIIILSLPLSAIAQNIPFGECRTGYWSSNRNLDNEKNIPSSTCFINWRPAYKDFLRIGINSRVGFRDASNTEGIYGHLREGFLEIESGAWTWRVGRQIIAWGRSDRINPTDNLSPRDLTLLVPDDDEQRNGINAALVRYFASKEFSITGIVAQYQPYKIPQGLLPTNLIKSNTPNRAELALKVDHTGGGIDWSISYFDGFDRFSRYRADFMATNTLIFRSTYQRAQVFGIDFASAQGNWTMRGEFSYAHLQQNCTTYCELRQRNVTRAVIGADREFLDTANINIQLFGIVRSYQNMKNSSAQQQRLTLILDRLNSEYANFEWGMTLRLSDSFFNENLKLEFAAIADFTNLSGVLRPRISYAFNDSLKLNIGADYFQGSNHSFFGVLEKNNLAFGELSFLF